MSYFSNSNPNTSNGRKYNRERELKIQQQTTELMEAIRKLKLRDDETEKLKSGIRAALAK